MSSKDRIKVVIGTDIKREAVLIDPRVSAADNEKDGEEAGNVLAMGTTSAELAEKVYGRKIR